MFSMSEALSTRFRFGPRVVPVFAGPSAAPEPAPIPSGAASSTEATAEAGPSPETAAELRAALARALMNHPRLLLADEPTGNLDTRTSLEIMEIFQDLNDRGMTILMVTHEPDIAQYCRRQIVLRDGVIVRDERVEKPLRAGEELKRLPATDELLMGGARDTPSTAAGEG